MGGKESVDAAGLPVAGIARIYDHDFMEIACEPEGRRESRGSTADYRYVVNGGG
jgi:hypothetical protein